MDCNLVVKHQFGSNHAQFEKAFGYANHDHLICQNCGKVIEFCDPRLGLVMENLKKFTEFRNQIPFSNGLWGLQQWRMYKQKAVRQFKKIT